MVVLEVTKSENSGVKGDTTSNMSYFHCIGKEPLIYRTIGQQLSIVANEVGERDAFVFVEEGKRITFSELLREADRLAAGFQCLGLCKGDRVGILASNVTTWPIAMFACARAGLIAVHLNPTYSAQEIQACLAKVSAKVLIAPETFGPVKYYDKFLEIIPELNDNTLGIIQCNKLPSLSRIIIDSEKHFTGTHRLCDIMELPTGVQIQSIEEYQSEISPESGCNIIFTSGFTGPPKAVLVSHYSSMNVAQLMYRFGIKNSVVCNVLPFCHVSGSGFVTTGCLYQHATIVVPCAMFNPEKILYAMSKEKCQFISASPPMYMALVAKNKELKFNIRDITVLSGGTQCPPEVMKELKQEFHMKKLMNAYGMTEYCGLCCTSLPDDPDTLSTESVGKVLHNLEVKVIDANGKLVPFGQPGELCVRGYATMIGYWGDEELTQSVLGRDGWLKTGDCFILQPNGYGKVVGRLDEMISKGKERIFPKEIENLLVTCQNIEEAYVVGVPDEEWGEELCAFIRLSNGCDEFSTNDLRDFCNGKISSFHIPRHVKVVKEFPKTMAGKIKKLELKAQFCKE